MRSIDKLLDHLYQSFSKDPRRFLAFRLRYNGTMRWDVAGGVLTTTVNGGSGSGLSVDLAGFTLATLAAHLASQAGYSLTDTALDSTTTALVLLDGGASQDDEPGLYGHASVLFGFLKAYSVELNAAEASIVDMLLQMQTRTATGEWLDFWGSYYDVPRLAGEFDSDYQSRIVPEVIRPKENNVAIAMAISEAFGVPALVTDYIKNPGASPEYGLFDVEFAYNLESGIDMSDYASRIRSFIDRFRAAGTHLHGTVLKASTLVDGSPGGVDQGFTLVTTAASFEDVAYPTATLTYNSAVNHDGSHVYIANPSIGEQFALFGQMLSMADAVATSTDALALTVSNPSLSDGVVVSDATTLSMTRYLSYQGALLHNGAVRYSDSVTTAVSFES